MHQDQSFRGRLLPTNIVARRLDKCDRMARYYMERGQLPAVRCGKRGKLWRAYEADVENFKLRLTDPADKAA